jgi:hypothetical protein
VVDELERVIGVALRRVGLAKVVHVG